MILGAVGALGSISGGFLGLLKRSKRFQGYFILILMILRAFKWDYGSFKVVSRPIRPGSFREVSERSLNQRDLNGISMGFRRFKRQFKGFQRFSGGYL